MAVPDFVGKGESGMEKKLKEQPSAASGGSPAKHWRVEVSTYGEPILAIETEMYAGKEDLTVFQPLTHLMKIPLAESAKST